MKKNVEANQVWLISTSGGARVRMRVDSIEGETVHLRTLMSGRRQSFSLATLVRGRRASRLVVNADGSEAPESVKDHRSKSSYRAMLAVRMRDGESLSRDAIAERLGCGLATVDRLLKMGREIASETQAVGT